MSSSVIASAALQCHLKLSVLVEDEVSHLICDCKELTILQSTRQNRFPPSDFQQCGQLGLAEAAMIQILLAQHSLFQKFMGTK